MLTSDWPQFGIFARNLRAISGDNVDSIQLLDEGGCPTDPVIFSGLEKVAGSNDLQGTFEAFKFSDSSVVRFQVGVYGYVLICLSIHSVKYFLFLNLNIFVAQVSVQFCVGECRPVSCDNGKESFGRRRRSAEAGGETSVTPRPLPDFSVATLPSMPGAGQPRASQLVYDDRIGQEIIEGDTDLSKEIYVESGTTVDQVRDPGDLGTRVDAGQKSGSKLN